MVKFRRVWSPALPALNSPVTLGNDTAPGAAGYVGEMDEFQLVKSRADAGAASLCNGGTGR